MSALAQIDDWPVDHAAAAVVDQSGVVASHGDLDATFALASVTKLLTTYGVLIATEEGTVSLEDALGPPGSSVEHLLSHASGLGLDNAAVAMSAPATRRIYSNAGFELLGEHVAEHSSIVFGSYVDLGVFVPLNMTRTRLAGSPAHGGISTAGDLATFICELFQPTLIDASTLSRATAVAFPGLDGVVPGFGAQRPCDWGLGFEIHASKSPHWTGSHNSPRTFGHFGQSGTFVWVDPPAGIGVVALTDRVFGEWAKAAWPGFSDAILAEWGVGHST